MALIKKVKKTAVKKAAATRRPNPVKAKKPGFTLAQLRKFSNFKFVTNPTNDIEFNVGRRPEGQAHSDSPLVLIIRRITGNVFFIGGCRYFSLQEALVHWNPKTYHRAVFANTKAEAKRQRAVAKATLSLVVKGMDKAAKLVRKHNREATRALKLAAKSQSQQTTGRFNKPA